jgi:hypothetical protein
MTRDGKQQAENRAILIYVLSKSYSKPAETFHAALTAMSAPGLGGE